MNFRVKCRNYSIIERTRKKYNQSIKTHISHIWKILFCSGTWYISNNNIILKQHVSRFNAQIVKRSVYQQSQIIKNKKKLQMIMIFMNSTHCKIKKIKIFFKYFYQWTKYFFFFVLVHEQWVNFIWSFIIQNKAWLILKSHDCLSLPEPPNLILLRADWVALILIKTIFE